ncbi:hypothetical protein O1451_09360 [Bacteroides fragilis]|uniref:hypothetical protein n=1 Tax=Bacteroides fragilis TaxID=817 RepID=UPI0022AB4385|nr:hypothetical protein [Bacteroides fragilis]MCZ2606760.1 hypothetical protein [Bacteroides fragilis]
MEFERKQIDEEPQKLGKIDSVNTDSISTDSVKKKDAFSLIDRQVSESDLKSLGTLRWLLNEHDKYEECIKQLDDYKEKFYNCDKEKSVIEEKLKNSTSFDILYSLSLSAGSALIGVAPSISDDISKWILPIIGGLLFIGGIITKIVHK